METILADRNNLLYTSNFEVVYPFFLHFFLVLISQHFYEATKDSKDGFFTSINHAFLFCLAKPPNSQSVSPPFKLHSSVSSSSFSNASSSPTYYSSESEFLINEDPSDLASVFSMSSDTQYFSSNSTSREKYRNKLWTEIASGGEGHTDPFIVKNRKRKIYLPPRRVCKKGEYDIYLDACVWHDQNDKVFPTYKCPSGSTLDANFCYGRIISDYELNCRLNFDSSIEELCTKIIFYTPNKIFCPEGFQIKSYTEKRIKQCVRKKYTTPVKRPVIGEDNTPSFACNKMQNKCVKPQKSTFDKKYILECNEGDLVKLKNTNKTVCMVRIVVAGEPQEACRSGYHWAMLSEFGAACVRIDVEDAVRTCPKPRPALLPILKGDPTIPFYKYDPIDNCVAYKMKAKDGACPFGYTYRSEFCYRKYILPYYMDCNNAEGYAFVWDAKRDIGVCEYIFTPYKWSIGISNISKRQKLNSLQIHLFSNPYDIKRAFISGENKKKN